MDAEARNYWRFADAQQAKAMRAIGQRMRDLPDEITAAAAIFPPTGDYLAKRAVSKLHRYIDKWHEESYWGSQWLAMQAQYFRRRWRISSNDAFALMLLMAFVSNYSGMADAIKPLYEDIFRRKYKELTGGDFSGTLPFRWDGTILPTGLTMMGSLFAEASYRSRRVAQVISGLMGLDEEERDEGEPLVLMELDRAENALLRKSPEGDNWSGVFDSIMAFVVGYAMIEISMILPGDKFYFHAVIDDRTTTECRSLNGKVFDRKDMKLSVNLPPIHPPPHPCRSWISFQR